MNGFVVLLKPPGMTSNNAVYDVRRIFDVQHVGHLGTLDPGASGVLPIAMGKATKLFDYFLEHEKSYRFEITFGKETDTLDSYGAVIKEDMSADISQNQVIDVLNDFIGEQEQEIPAYSALKVNGRKMYDMARDGKEIPKRSHIVNIQKLNVVRKTGLNRYLLDIRCSKGTYIRMICRDIGRKFGTCAYMSYLLRTSVQDFGISQAASIRELENRKNNGTLQECLISCESVLKRIPRITLPSDRKIPTLNGLETTWRKKDGIYALYSDEFLGLGECKDNRVRLKTLLIDRD